MGHSSYEFLERLCCVGLSVFLAFRRQRVVCHQQCQTDVTIAADCVGLGWVGGRCMSIYWRCRAKYKLNSMNRRSPTTPITSCRAHSSAMNTFQVRSGRLSADGVLNGRFEFTSRPGAVRYYVLNELLVSRVIMQHVALAYLQKVSK